MNQSGRDFPRAVDIMCTASSVGAAVALVGMMLLIAANVVARYLFGQPIEGATQLSGYFLVALTFLQLGDTHRARQHIQIDLLTSRLSSRAQDWLATFSTIFALVIVATAAWYTVQGLLRARSDATVDWASSLNIQIWVPMTLVPVGLVVLGLLLLFDLFYDVRKLR